MNPGLRGILRRAFGISLAVIFLGDLCSAGAGDRFAPHCQALAKIKAEFDAHTRWTVLTPGQFHFAQGLWVASPATPEGLPPGDSAMLVQRDGDKDGLIVWTRGPLACSPVPLPEAMIKLLWSIKTGKLDDDGNEL